MAGDVDRIAEVLEEHPDWHADAGDLEVVMCRLCEWTKRVSLVDPKGAESAFRAHQAEQLTAAGYGHVPTALHQAADDMSAEGRETFWRDDSPFHGQGRFWTRNQADWLRVRAEQAGGEA